MAIGISTAGRARISALFCSLTLVLAALSSRPFVEMGVNDDWSYIRSAFQLARTGHIVYFGWSEPILGWQLYWGALFLRLFGFSFSAPRFAILLVGAATTYFVHRILVRCGVGDFNATLGALTFALSPLFLPLAFSFMSDVAGLFAIVVCIDLCLRSQQAATNRGALLWLLFALIANLLLGTARQVAWLGALVIVPSSFWLLPGRRHYLGRALLVWLAGLAFMLVCVKWFQHQPFTQQDSPLDDIHNRLSGFEIADNVVRFALSVPLLLLPVLIGFVTPKWIHDRKSKLAAALGATSLCLATFLAYYMNHRRSLLNWLAPFSANYFTPQGVLNIPAIGARPTVLGPGVRALITFFVVAGILAVVACVVSRRSTPDRSTDNGLQQVTASRSVFVLLAPFTLAYCALLIPRGLDGLLFDRYLLPLLVVALVAMLLLYQRYVAARLPAASLVFLVVVSAYSVASMHDFYAMERARLAAADELRAVGVPPTSFYGGFEYDGWTQMESWGYFASPHLNLPPGSEHTPSWAFNTKPCGYMFYRMLPAIRPSYALSFAPATCQGPSRFAPVQYRTWLPPYAGYIYIQNVSLADPAPAGFAIKTN